MASDVLPHDSLGPHLSISTITLSALAVTILVGRMYGRIYLLRNVGSDDYCIVIAVLIALLLTISLCLGVRAGGGRHEWDIPPGNLSQISKVPLPIPTPFTTSPNTTQVTFASQIAARISLGFARASLLLQLLRLAPSPRMRKVLWAIFTISLLVTIAALVGAMLKCVSVEKPIQNAPSSYKLKFCSSYFPFYFTMGALNIATDFVCWLVPLKFIWGMTLPRRQKAGLFASFGVGGSVWIACIMRLVFLVELSNNGSIAANFTCRPPFPPLLRPGPC